MGIIYVLIINFIIMIVGFVLLVISRKDTPQRYWGTVLTAISEFVMLILIALLIIAMRKVIVWY